MNKLVQIIMPVHNRWEHTKQSLDSLIKNTDPELYDLYVINDGSDQWTTSDLYGYSTINQKINLMHPYQIAVGPGASRNWVAQRIKDSGRRGEFVYHSDSDVYFTEGWLEKLLNAYKQNEKKGIRLLGGGAHAYLQSSSFIESLGVKIGIKDAVSGYSQLMTWKTWDEFGNFDESMRNAEKKIAGSEDWKYCQDIIKAGYLVGSLEPEVVYHTGRTNTYGESATGAETILDREGIFVK